LWQKKNSKRKRNISPEKLDLKFEEEASKIPFLDESFVQCRNVDTSESRSKIPERF
jgi:hypothetical protein